MNGILEDYKNVEKKKILFAQKDFCHHLLYEILTLDSKDKFLTQKNFEKFLENYEKKIDFCEFLIPCFDFDKDGGLNFSEFYEMMVPFSFKDKRNCEEKIIIDKGKDLILNFSKKTLKKFTNFLMLYVKKFKKMKKGKKF